MANKFTLSALAGASIGLAGFVNLAIGGVPGAVLFSFGLLSVYAYGLSLFTGKAGRFEPDSKGFKDLLFILLGNIFGAAVVAMLTRISPLDLPQAAGKILASRLNLGWWKAGLLAIACGWIVEEAVASARAGVMAPTYFGVALFVLCGFPHSIADAFYYAAAPLDMLCANWAGILGVYGAIVLGNFIGCNLRRILGIPEEVRFHFRKS